MVWRTKSLLEAKAPWRTSSSMAFFIPLGMDICILRGYTNIDKYWSFIVALLVVSLKKLCRGVDRNLFFLMTHISESLNDMIFLNILFRFQVGDSAGDFDDLKITAGG